MEEEENKEKEEDMKQEDTKEEEEKEEVMAFLSFLDRMSFLMRRPSAITHIRGRATGGV